MGSTSSGSGYVGLVAIFVILLAAFVDLHLQKVERLERKLEKVSQSYRGMTFDEIYTQGILIGSLRTVDKLTKQKDEDNNTSSPPKPE